MSEDHVKYMQACNKNGIRVYPVPVYNHYYLEIEYNRSSEFNRKEVEKIVRGKIYMTIG